MLSVNAQMSIYSRLGEPTQTGRVAHSQPGLGELGAHFTVGHTGVKALRT